MKNMKKFIIAILTLLAIISTSSLFAADIDFSGNSNISTSQNPVIYSNTDYGFNLSLPASWQ
jgi:hypothetical protein